MMAEVYGNLHTCVRPRQSQVPEFDLAPAQLCQTFGGINKQTCLSLTCVVAEIVALVPPEMLAFI